MPDSPPKLIAYIDEAGCAGSKYGAGSSHFLVIAAAVLSASREDQVLSLFEEARHELKTNRKFRKFSKSNDRDNYVLTKLIAKKPTRIVQVALHKPSMKGKFTRDHHKEEYQYLVKMVLERTSWLAREAAKIAASRGDSSDPADNLCQLVFSEQKLYSYDDMCDYFNRLKHGQGRYNCSIDWRFVHEELLIQPHQDEHGLHIADIAASALFRAIEPHHHGITDDRFRRNLLRAIARYNKKQFGLKLFPPKEIAEMIANGEFEFLRLMRR